ncbi:MAG: hypothetical protein R2809_06730 [Flavobacteriales bacterium]
MDLDPEDILDAPEDKNSQKKNYFLLGIVSLSFAALALVFNLMKWPGVAVLAIIGFILISIRYLLIFFSADRKFSDWMYFLGRITLLMTVATFFVLSEPIRILFALPAIFFILGLMTSKNEN